jgi:hypothetical protein
MESRYFRPSILFPAVVIGFAFILTSCLQQGARRDSGLTGTSGAGSSEFKPGVITFRAEPPEIGEGGAATLIWETDNASSVSISSLGRVLLSGSQTVRPNTSTTYELTAANRAGETTKTARVLVMIPLMGDLPPGEAGDRSKKKVLPDRLSMERDATDLSPVDPSRRTVTKKDEADGAARKDRTSVVTLKWDALRGAVSYTVEIDCFNCCQANRWCADVGREYKVIRSIKTTEYKIELDKAQRGRWRVWSVDKNGVQGKKSAWQDIR